ncbi:Carboxylic ester hydrolase [Mycena venus]|nr:Carboxylic ester hydrolase [Mycena venus]
MDDRSSLPSNRDASQQDLFAHFVGLACVPFHNPHPINNFYIWLSEYVPRSSCGCVADTMTCLCLASTWSFTSDGSSTPANYQSTLFLCGCIMDGRFISVRPMKPFKSGKFIKVPVFFGYNTNESSNWSAGLRDSTASTSEPDATRGIVYNLLTLATFDFSTSTDRPPS